jgi:leader peptidase (prepilin peptidase)/N-methyltransferase
VLIVVTVVFGLLIGSFLNVVVARVPAGESVASPPSRCPSCRTPIQPRDNLPVLSWLLLRGRARCCGTAISRRYPLVEAGTGLAFGLVAAWVSANAAAAGWPLRGHGLFHPAAVVALVAFLFLAAVSIALALIDIDVKRLPFWIVTPSWAVGAATLGGAALLAGNRGGAVRMLLGGVGLWGIYRLLHAIYPRGMAYGDVRLAGLIGGYLAWLGWAPLAVGAFLGFLIGALGGVALIALRGAGLKTQIPYGPYMLAGTWIGLTAGAPIGQGYLNLFGL